NAYSAIYQINYWVQIANLNPQEVNQMLELHRQLASSKTNHDKTVIQRQIDATDRQIDQLVYELYGLTAEEIKIVEEGLA
ncbi:MAG: hypothetical protein NUV76_00250, partial [Candidatus Kuenenia sp.]|nr:hypothetical protein [Candidatus Kuenenia sp.]